MPLPAQLGEEREEAECSFFHVKDGGARVATNFALAGAG
jgi:hypothetical protein